MHLTIKKRQREAIELKIEKIPPVVNGIIYLFFPFTALDLIDSLVHAKTTFPRGSAFVLVVLPT